MSGSKLAERLTHTKPGLKVLYISGYTENAIQQHGILEAGVNFLQKPVNEQCLLDQLHAAIAQDRRDRREDEERREAGKRLEGLSAREWDVLMEIVAGRTNKQMAQRFGVTIKTVEFHRANIMKKAGAESVVELVYLLLKSGWDPRKELRGRP